MPPPPPGPSQPRRHPDFAKDQQYPQYNQQRPAYPGELSSLKNVFFRESLMCNAPIVAGWPSTTSQYNSSSGNNRVQYPNQQNQPQAPQQQQPQQQPQQPPPPVASASSAASAVGAIASGQQWGSQQPNRTSSQPSLNTIGHTPPPWDHRYSNQPSPLYPPPGTHQVCLLFFIFLIQISYSIIFVI